MSKPKIDLTTELKLAMELVDDDSLNSHVEQYIEGAKFAKYESGFVASTPHVLTFSFTGALDDNHHTVSLVNPMDNDQDVVSTNIHLGHKSVATRQALEIMRLSALCDKAPFQGKTFRYMDKRDGVLISDDLKWWDKMYLDQSDRPFKKHIPVGEIYTTQPSDQPIWISGAITDEQGSVLINITKQSEDDEQHQTALFQAGFDVDEGKLSAMQAFVLALKIDQADQGHRISPYIDFGQFVGQRTMIDTLSSHLITAHNALD